MNKYILNLTMVFSTILLLSACGGGDSSTPPTLQSIKIVAQTTQLPIGADIQLQAIARFTDGTQQDITSTANWSSSNTGIASITSSGQVSGVALGSTEIDISYNNFTDIEAFTVINAELVSLELTPSSLNMDQYEELQLVVKGIYTDSSEIILQNINSWSSSDESIANVTSSGLVTAKTLGNIIITASYNGLTATSSINIDTEVTKYSVSNTMELRVVLNMLTYNRNNLIVLSPGIYKTTDSGSGPFTSNVHLAATLTFKGSASGVIFDGDNSTGNIFYIKGHGWTKFNNLIIQNVKSSAIETDYDEDSYFQIEIKDTLIQNNSGGITSSRREGPEGTATKINIINSKFINNGTVVSIGSSRTANLNINNSTFYNNTNGILGGGTVTSINSIFNNHEKAISSTKITSINSLFVDNNHTAITLTSYSHSEFINTSFVHNTIDIDGIGTASIDYSFIDINKITVQYLSSNLIFDNNPGFVDYNSNNFHLTSVSPMINAGTESLSNHEAPLVDLDNISRLQGVAIDIGPYEFIE